MKEAHRIRKGLNEWNHPPEGYVRLGFWDVIQGGDVLRINDEMYAEYPETGFLVQSKSVVGNGIWYRKQN